MVLYRSAHLAHLRVPPAWLASALDRLNLKGLCLKGIHVLSFRGQHRHLPDHLQHWHTIPFSFFSSFISILFSSNLSSGPQHFQRGLSREPAV